MTPRVLVAPDSFKGTFSAIEVADAVARGLEGGGLTADRCPVADGGEGTMAAIVAARGGELRTAPSHDPLGRAIEARFGLVDDGTVAVVETAVASGLASLTPEELDPLRASTYGTGELICTALDAGVDEVLVAVGGSATVDGGAGASRALAARGRRPADGSLVVLCDVTTPWERCAAVYGPQKGADAPTVAMLEARLERLAGQLPRDPRGVPGTGAAGGLAGALWASHGARLAPGAARVLDVVGFDARLRGAAAVICGEGRIDAQTSEGKIVGAIAARAAQHGVPVHALVGRSAIDDRSRRSLGLASVREATTLAALEAAARELAASLLDAGAAAPA